MLNCLNKTAVVVIEREQRNASLNHCQQYGSHRNDNLLNQTRNDYIMKKLPVTHSHRGNASASCSARPHSLSTLLATESITLAKTRERGHSLPWSIAMAGIVIVVIFHNIWQFAINVNLLHRCRRFGVSQPLEMLQQYHCDTDHTWRDHYHNLITHVCTLQQC